MSSIRNEEMHQQVAPMTSEDSSRGTHLGITDMPY